MVKLNVKSIFTNGDFWRILCEALFALGKFIAFVIGDGSLSFDDESLDS